MDDAVALLDAGYKKHKHAFLFVKHGGFEEVFLANNESDMNDWIAKLNYAATFRTVGVRMRGFLGANYEGQRPELGQNDSVSSMKSAHTASGETHTRGRQINQQLAGEILAYRRQIMTDKIAEADNKLAATQKELDNLLRNARHLQICSPIQAKTREALILAAGRMSAKLKWTRVEMWRTRCHREVMMMDLEQEIGSNSATSVLRESSLTSTPQKKTSLKTSNQSLQKSEIKGGDGASSPKSSFSILSTRSTSQAVMDKARSPDILRHILSDDAISHDTPLFVESLDQAMISTEQIGDSENRTSSLSTKSMTPPSLNPRTSFSSSHLGPSDANSIGDASRLTAPTPNIDGEESLLREAGSISGDRVPDAPPRADSSDPDHGNTTNPSLETLSNQRTGKRRNMQRSLRDPQHSTQSPQSVRLRKGKEPIMHSSPAAILRGNSQQVADGLARSTGSFTVHGKKASVITLGSEWDSMSSEDRMRLRKLAQANSKESDPDADSRTLLSPKAEEDEEAHDDNRAEEATRLEVENKDTASIYTAKAPAKISTAGQPEESDEISNANGNDYDDVDVATETSNESDTEDDGWISSRERFVSHGSDCRSSQHIFDADTTMAADHLSIPSSADLRHSPKPQAIHA